MIRSRCCQPRQSSFSSRFLGATTATVAIALTLGFCAGPAVAQFTNGKMTCELSSNTASPSTSVTLDLFLEDAVDVRGYQATIQITRTSGSGEVTVPCPGGVAVDENRPDFIFPDFDSENLEPDCPDCGLVVPHCDGQRVAVARVTGGVDVADGPANLATFTLDVSPEAAPGSTFEISIVPFPASILAMSDKASIPFEIGPTCELTIRDGGQVCRNNIREGTETCDGTDDDMCPGFCSDECTCPTIPTVSVWGLAILALLLLTAAKIYFGRRGPKATGIGACLFTALVLVLALAGTASAGGVTGACCLFEGNCVESAEFDCTVEFEGIYQGDGTTCEGDADGDGVDGMCGDACPNDPEKLEPGVCGCNEPDDDSDGDAVPGCLDNCPANSNPGQEDADGDGVGDVCDSCPEDPEDLCDDCLNNADCDDGDVCTRDRCIEDNCVYDFVPHGDLGGANGCNPDGLVTAHDVEIVANAFSNELPFGCSPHNIDIKSSDACEPDGRVDMFDILAVLDAFAGTPNCSSCPSTTPTEQEPPQSIGDRNIIHPVYLFSGEFYEPVVDLRIRGRGIDFIWARKYRSKIGPDTPIGNGWDFSYNIWIESNGQDTILHNGDTRADRLFLQSDGTWSRRGHFHELSQKPDLSYTLTFANRDTWNFRPLNGSAAQGKISTIVDRNGNTLSFDYDALGRLIKIHDTLDIVDSGTGAHSRDVTITYLARCADDSACSIDEQDCEDLSACVVHPDGLIGIVTDYVGRQIRYSYYRDGDSDGANGDLKSVTLPPVTGPNPCNNDPDGRTTTYTYTTGFADERLNHNLLTITDAKGQTYVVNEYDPTTNPDDLNFDRIIRQTWGDPGDVIDLVYEEVTPNTDNAFASIKTIVNDRVGNVSEHYHDRANQMVKVMAFTGRADPDLATTASDNRPFGQVRPSDPPFFEGTVEYNDDYLATRIVYANENEERFTYDENNNRQRLRGRLFEHLRLPGPLGGDQTEICETFQYDGGFGGGGCCGTNFVTLHIDGNGHKTTHIYDVDGNRIETTFPISTIVVSMEYNGFGQMTAKDFPENDDQYDRRDEFTYYESDDIQYGYLKDRIVDTGPGGCNLTSTFEWDNLGRLIKFIDPRDHETQYVYDELDELVRRMAPEASDGSGVRYTQDYCYDRNGNRVSIDLLNIDEQGILQTNTHFTTRYEYEILNLVVRKTAETDETHSIVTEYGYDANRDLDLTTYGEGTNGHQPTNTVRIEHDERRKRYRKIRGDGGPNQSTMQIEYDGNGNPIRIISGIEDAVPHVTVYEYDGYNRVIRSIDPMGNKNVYVYDAVAILVSWSIFGELIDIPGDGGNVRLFEASATYDTLNRPIRTELEYFDPATQNPIDDGKDITQFEYDDLSQLKRIVDDNGNETRILYDGCGRQRLVTDAKGSSTSYTYDPNSNVIAVASNEVSSGRNPPEVYATTTEFDNLNRPIQTVDNVGNTHTFGYDSRYDRVVHMDARGVETRNVYDGISRLRQTIIDMNGNGADANDPEDIVTTMGWDDSDRMIEEVDAHGNRMRFAYDDLNRQIVTLMEDGTLHQVGRGAVWGLGDDEPNLSQFVSGFNAHSNVTTMTDANRTVITFGYDEFDRVTSKLIDRASIAGGDPSDVFGTTSEVYEWDGLSRIVRADSIDQSDPTRSSRVERKYDSLRRTTSETIIIGQPFAATGPTTMCAYDGVGNKTQCTYPGGRVMTTTYDELNRKKVISDQGGMIAAYEYIGPQRVLHRDYRNNTRLDYSYDGLVNDPSDFGVKNVIRTRNTFDPNGVNTTLDERTFAWDSVGNKSQRADVLSGGSMTAFNYEYDRNDRMIRSVRTGAGEPDSEIVYNLDTVGNRESVVGGPNPGGYILAALDFLVNQYTTTPLDGRRHDPNGNVISLTDMSGAPPLADVKYDYRNQMIEYFDHASNKRHKYVYDAYGRRIVKVIDADGSSQEIRYLYDNLQVVEERDESDITQATYAYGSYIDEVLNMQRDGGDFFYHTDDMFNVTAVTNAGGTVVERYEYGDYGEPEVFDATGTPIAGSTIDNPYLFTGRRFEPETGLHYYRTRYLDPGTGRFTTRDTAGVWADPANIGNAYTYVGNNPWSRVDPTGMATANFNGSGCSGPMRAELTSALGSAESMAGRAKGHLDNVTRYKKGCDTRYTLFFGSYRGYRFNTVLTNFRRIRNSLRDGVTNFRCLGVCVGSPRAFVTRLGQWNSGQPGANTIFICPKFWGGGYTWFRSGIATHEVTHLIVGTDDFSDAAPLFRFLNPDRLINNATSYQLFAEDVISLGATALFVPIFGGLNCAYEVLGAIFREIGRVHGAVRREFGRVTRRIGREVTRWFGFHHLTYALPPLVTFLLASGYRRRRRSRYKKKR